MSDSDSKKMSKQHQNWVKRHHRAIVRDSIAKPKYSGDITVSISLV